MSLLKIGTRPSPLAIRQVEEIKSFFPWVKFKIVKIATSGDKDKRIRFSDIEGSDFFTKEIDQALLKGKIDIAVHSSKDLPDKIQKGLKILWETPTISPSDVLVSRNKLKLSELASGSKIGTSSLRRKNQIYALRPDLKIVDIRGNVQERLALLDSGNIDALIVAEAALIRLGLLSRVSEVLNNNIFNTHPKQGSLTLVIKEDRWQEVRSILSVQGRGIGS